ncbi:ubiquitin-conjugating enzyme [Microthyrium microscopicum]|uniref:E2 ubiquitin-conjugating enzyme n=1 Tax=Microthyrium microscopicum TaxID=703497 RepID=A0A6A6U049_9PEZI|nr:ubiquitin-conjugating enzyme [Microthyrium microscopicum]
MAAPNKRVLKEFSDCSTNPPPGCKVSLVDEANFKEWNVLIDGPANSPYAGGRFKVNFVLPDDYPFKPPVVTFKTKIYHCNVTNDATGSVCIAMLKPDAWKPASMCKQVIEAIRGLLIVPNVDDPLELEIATQYKENRVEFDKKAKEWTKKYRA